MRCKAYFYGRGLPNREGYGEQWHRDFSNETVEWIRKKRESFCRNDKGNNVPLVKAIEQQRDETFFLFISKDTGEDEFGRPHTLQFIVVEIPREILRTVCATDGESLEEIVFDPTSNTVEISTKNEVPGDMSLPAFPFYFNNSDTAISIEESSEIESKKLPTEHIAEQAPTVANKKPNSSRKTIIVFACVTFVLVAVGLGVLSWSQQQEIRSQQQEISELKKKNEKLTSEKEQALFDVGSELYDWVNKTSRKLAEMVESYKNKIPKDLYNKIKGCVHKNFCEPLSENDKPDPGFIGPTQPPKTEGDANEH